MQVGRRWAKKQRARRASTHGEERERERGRRYAGHGR